MYLCSNIPVLYIIIFSLSKYTVLSLIHEDNRKEAFSYLAIVIFLLSFLAPFVLSLFKIGYNHHLKVAVGGGYIFYVIVGYYISHYDISKKHRLYIYIAGFIGLMMHILWTWYLSYNAGKVITTFKEYTNVPAVLYSVAIFVYFRYFDFSKIKPGILKVINMINKYTFSIYLIHYFVIDNYKRLFVPNINSIVYRMLFPWIVLIICIVISKCIRSIPVLKKILP